MKIEELTPEMVEEAKKCETPEERLAFIRENGIELTDEQLEGISGGGWDSGDVCPKDPTGKKSHKWERTGREEICYNLSPGMQYEYRCANCGDMKWDSAGSLG